MKFKKILTILLIMLSLSLFCACGDGDYVGDWHFEKVVCVTDGAEYVYTMQDINNFEYQDDVSNDDVVGQIKNNICTMKPMLQNYHLQIKSDYTCLAVYNEISKDGTWKITDSKMHMYFEGQDEVCYVLKDKTLYTTNTYNGVSYTFILVK